MPRRKKDLFDRPMDSFSLRFFVVPSDLVGRSHLLVIGVVIFFRKNNQG